jgi:HlyD family secretion protein
MNPDGLLYPFMTANVQFELDKRTDVLKVPNGALRYTPTSEDQVAPESRAQLEQLAQRGDSKDASGEPQPEGSGSGEPQSSSEPRPEGSGQDSTASQPTDSRNMHSHAGSQPAGSSPAGTQRAKKNHDKGLLWVLEGEFLKPIKVHVGMTDGTMTEVQGADLKEGLAVVVSEQRPTGAPQGGASPFMPQMRRR